MGLQYLDALKALGASPSTRFVFPMEFGGLTRQLTEYTERAFDHDPASGAGTAAEPPPRSEAGAPAA